MNFLFKQSVSYNKRFGELTSLTFCPSHNDNIHVTAKRVLGYNIQFLGVNVFEDIFMNIVLHF